MSLTSTSLDSGDSDFYGNTAGSIQAWVYTEVEAQSASWTEIRYIFGFDQGSTYSDSQDFYASIDGDIVYDSTLTNNKSSGSYKFYETVRSYARPDYGDSWGTHEARAQVSGIYNGPTSNTGTEEVDTKVPDKAGTVLGPPTSLTHVFVDSDQINYDWNAPPSSGIGPAPSSYWLQVATNSDMTGLVWNQDLGDNDTWFNAVLLNKATTYYARVRAVNSVGYGSWSSIHAASTSATVPDQMVAPSPYSATTNGFSVSFVSPNNGGSAITSYTIEVSENNFASVAATFTGVLYAPKVLTGLSPGKKYKARIKAINAIGTSTVSAASSEIQTLGGVKTWTGSAWGESIVRHWNGSAWVVVVVRKWNGSSWVV